ncbi:sugar ABC transporter permease [Thiospirochaeta perfilievii]|uniref:Sugar ABC transporter permease n=1 Tax=Thiospirochaeta perfilievii TaxID=252967 RepID=A0A5C1QAP0_9SPIO|nr:ABC transporter permease subunit [Thiospirochaeta perfilievii]QEN04120.1 sugar ABC transporter permease [Thiospirochaeta perfilievii]
MGKGKTATLFKELGRNKTLLLMIMPFVIHLIIFRYVPIWGWIMAFQDYNPLKGVSGSEFVGLKHFKALFSEPLFLKVIRNTLAISTIKLVLGTSTSLFLAILLNETRNKYFKSITQTITSLPHFISWVVTASLVREMLSTDGGMVNEFLMFIKVIDKPILWLGVQKYFWWLMGWTNVWKEIGWGAIIYLAAMTGIDSQLYEAAKIDGASRIQRIIHVTIPGIKATFLILLIMNIGYMLNAGYEQMFLLKSGLTQDVAQVFELFAIEWGLNKLRYSFAAASGIFASVVSIILITVTNKISHKLGETALF